LTACSAEVISLIRRAESVTDIHALRRYEVDELAFPETRFSVADVQRRSVVLKQIDGM